jgi:Holliday junction resolvase RusA-like endonuclease
VRKYFFIVVPGNPTGKARARTVKAGNKFISFTPKNTRCYEATIRQFFSALYPAAALLEGPLYITTNIYLQLPKSRDKKKDKEKIDADKLRCPCRPDIDNCLKSFKDALEGLAYRNDSQFVIVHAEKWYSRRPRAEIEVGEVTDGA